MRKIVIFMVMLFMACSCGVYKSYYADITLYGADGKALKQWDGALLQSESNTDGSIVYGGIKNGGGLNFITEKGESMYVSGGIIIASNIRDYQDISEINELIDRYYQLQSQYEFNKSLMKTEKYENKADLMNANREIKKEMSRIGNLLYKQYYYLTY